MSSNNDRVRKRNRLLTFVILGMIELSAIRGYTAKNYLEPDFPYYAGNYAQGNLQSVAEITVVSYNIWFGEDIDQAISELKEIQRQQGLDIVLLQEMDETGTEKIARELQFNYVYYPAAIEPTYDKNFGNAVLSRWPITESTKLILPHQSLSNRMSRTATKARIHIHGTDLLAYSLHTESIFMLPRFRKDQYVSVINDVDPKAQFVIIGGDFNSFTGRAVDNVANDFDQAGFGRASEGSPYAVIKLGIKLSTDHIFTKGFTVEEAGNLDEATASDHLPVWVRLRLK